MSRKILKDPARLAHVYERYISPIALIAGFLADNFILLKRVDLLQTNLILGFYLLVAAAGIVWTHLVTSGKVKGSSAVDTLPFVLVAMQFSFGGLFSGYLSLYSRSASLSVSWIFIIILAGLLIGNERFMRFYSELKFQVTLYFATLFSFLIFFLPVVLSKIGPLMFVLSGILSLLIITLFLWLLDTIVRDAVRKDLPRIAMIIGVIFASFNLFYFLNLIPPLPLALKTAGVYHSVTRTSVGYELIAERRPWYEYYVFNYNPIYHAQPGEPVYVFSAIFAPSGLSTGILHEWQRYDEQRDQWDTVTRLSFKIVGGRDGGYRGYSLKSNPEPGKWRVNVVTEYGQLIGRISFTVVTAREAPKLYTSVQ